VTASPPPGAHQPARRRYDFAQEVIDLLTRALARDDERRRHGGRVRRCPDCGLLIINGYS
jgi:hypothetical protein